MTALQTPELCMTFFVAGMARERYHDGLCGAWEAIALWAATTFTILIVSRLVGRALGIIPSAHPTDNQ